MLLQKFKTMCDNCNEEIVSVAADFTGENEIIVDFLSEMEFKCNNCDTETIIEIHKRNTEG